MSIHFTDDEIHELAETVVLEHLSQDLEYMTTVEILEDELPRLSDQEYDEITEAVHSKAEGILSELAAHHGLNGF